MLCYITCVMLCYITCYGMLYNMCYVDMLYDMLCYVIQRMLYDIGYVMLCYTTYVKCYVI